MLQELLLTLLADLCPWSDLLYPNEYCTDVPYSFFETTWVQHGMPGPRLLKDLKLTRLLPVSHQLASHSLAKCGNSQLVIAHLVEREVRRALAHWNGPRHLVSVTP